MWIEQKFGIKQPVKNNSPATKFYFLPHNSAPKTFVYAAPSVVNQSAFNGVYE
jgi:hypothetical protein